MSSEQQKQEWDKFSSAYTGLIGAMVMTKDGTILQTYGEAFATEAENKIILEAWLAEILKPFVIGKGRFVALKNDPLQFVCTNKTDNLSMVGSTTKKGNYCLLLVGPANNLGMLPMSVEFSRWVWELF
jgi:hypothetical protein